MIINNNLPIVEKDPTVPDWAKQPNKPNYTANEVGALPDTTNIPSVEGLASENYVNNVISNLSATNIKTGTVAVERGGTGETSIIDNVYTTARYRASSLNATETTPTQNGVIYWMYE